MPAPEAFLHPDVDALLRTISERRGAAESRERLRAMELLARTIRPAWIAAAARKSPERVCEAFRLCLEEPWPEMHENVCIAARVVGEPVLSPLLGQFASLARGEEIVERQSSSRTKCSERGRARLAAVRALACFPSEAERLAPDLLSVIREVGTALESGASSNSRGDGLLLRQAAGGSLASLLQNGPAEMQDAFGRTIASTVVSPTADDHHDGTHLPDEVVGIEWLYRTPEFQHAAMLSACNRWEAALAALPHLNEKGAIAVFIVYGVMHPERLDTLFDVLSRRDDRALVLKVTTVLLSSPSAKVRLSAIRRMGGISSPEPPVAPDAGSLRPERGRTI